MLPPLRVAVLASGRGSNFQALQQSVQDGRLRAQLVGVFSDRPAAPVLGLAARADVPCWVDAPRSYDTRAAFDQALFAALAACRPELVVCAGYMRLIGAAVLAPWLGRIINLHPSLLPRFPGLDTHARALAAGMGEHGASVHFVTPELDAGPVLAQARVAVEHDDSAEALASRVRAREHPLLVSSVELFAARRVGWNAGQPLLDGQRLSRPLLLAPDGTLQCENVEQ